ncbi:uncharacterized protein LOC144355233 [Saccoglossus kowalevskii]
MHYLINLHLAGMFMKIAEFIATTATETRKRHGKVVPSCVNGAKRTEKQERKLKKECKRKQREERKKLKKQRKEEKRLAKKATEELELDQKSEQTEDEKLTKKAVRPEHDCDNCDNTQQNSALAETPEKMRIDTEEEEEEEESAADDTDVDLEMLPPAFPGIAYTSTFNPFESPKDHDMVEYILPDLEVQSLCSSISSFDSYDDDELCYSTQYQSDEDTLDYNL